MPLKEIYVRLTDETKEKMDKLVEEFYKNADTFALTAVGHLIKQREHALSLREKAFSKKY